MILGSIFFENIWITFTYSFYSETCLQLILLIYFNFQAIKQSQQQVIRNQKEIMDRYLVTTTTALNPLESHLHQKKYSILFCQKLCLFRIKMIPFAAKPSSASSVNHQNLVLAQFFPHSTEFFLNLAKFGILSAWVRDS